MSQPLALVTGGSRGLGYEAARGLASKGFDLALVASHPERLQAAAAKIKSEFPATQCTIFPVDLADPHATSEIADRINKQLPTPKILIAAHGVMSEKMSKTLRTTHDEWRRVISINLDAVFILVNAIVPAMALARDGRVIVFSACLGRMSGPGNTGGLAPYRISKSGVNALVRNLAHETGLGARGLLVDATCPNHSRTDMGGDDAPRRASQGADTAIWLATRQFNAGDCTGALWEDRQVIPW